MLYRGRNKKMKPACIYIVTYTKTQMGKILHTHTIVCLTYIVYKYTSFFWRHILCFLISGYSAQKSLLLFWVHTLSRAWRGILIKGIYIYGYNLRVPLLNLNLTRKHESQVVVFVWFVVTYSGNFKIVHSRWNDSCSWYYWVYYNKGRLRTNFPHGSTRTWCLRTCDINLN